MSENSPKTTSSANFPTTAYTHTDTPQPKQSKTPADAKIDTQKNTQSPTYNPVMTPDFCEQLIFEKMDAFGYVVDLETYEIVHIRQPLIEVLGLTKEDLEHKCYKAIFQFESPCPFCPKEALKTSPSHKRYRHNYQNGKHFTIIDHAYRNNGRDYLIHTTYDVSDEMKSIFNFEHLNSANDAIIACATLLFSQKEPNEAIPQLLKIICSHYGAEMATIFERDTINDISKCAYHYSTNACLLDLTTEENSFQVSTQHAWVNLLGTKNYYFAENSPEINEAYPILEGPCALKNNKNVLFVPLKMNDNFVGALPIYNLTKNLDAFEPITTIAAFIINMLHMKYSQKQLQTTIDLLAARNELNHAILDCAQTLIYEDENITTTIERLLKIIAEYFDADYTFIFKKKPGTNLLFSKYKYYNAPSVFKTNNPEISNDIFNSWMQEFGEENQKLAYIEVNDSSLKFLECEDTSYKHIVRDQVKNFILVPLKQHDSIRGYIWVENIKQNLDGKGLLETVANFIVNHITKDELLKKLEHLSFTDKLTGMYNRNFYLSYIEQIQHRTHTNLGIVYADVNGLKVANDNFGHEYGDVLLQWSAKFLKENLTNLVFRVGGDEFVCFVEKISEEQFNTLMKDIKEILQQFPNNPLSVGSSWLDKSQNLQEHLTASDQRMYDDKQKYYERNREDCRPFKTILSDLKGTLEEFENEIKKG